MDNGMNISFSSQPSGTHSQASYTSDSEASSNVEEDVRKHPTGKRGNQTEDQRRERRRLTNRKAAQRSRQRERDKEQRLMKELQDEQSRNTTLKFQKKQFAKIKEELEQILAQHNCILNVLQSPVISINAPKEPRSYLESINVEESDLPNTTNDDSVLKRVETETVVSETNGTMPFTSYQLSNQPTATVTNMDCESTSQTALEGKSYSYVPLDVYKDIALKLATGKTENISQSATSSLNLIPDSNNSYDAMSGTNSIPHTTYITTASDIESSRGQALEEDSPETTNSGFVTQTINPNINFDVQQDALVAAENIQASGGDVSLQRTFSVYTIPAIELNESETTAEGNPDYMAVSALLALNPDVAE